MRKQAGISVFLVLAGWAGCVAAAHAAAAKEQAQPVAVEIWGNASPRVEFGASLLVDALRSVHVAAEVKHGQNAAAGKTLIIGTPESVYQSADTATGLIQRLKPEGFTLSEDSVIGSDASGELYGCLELARRIREAGAIPSGLAFTDSPVMKLRGTCIGMQKPYILPGRHVYEYPYTPELFPFFYDKAFWQRYLDFLLQQRMNTLYLWAGHPFASLVQLPDYPYAVEVPPDVLARNQEMMHYIASEADKRGIWVVQMFYNILVSQPFAEHNGIATQLSAPTPLVADYTRKSIAAFIQQYPNVGLMVCLGEALKGQQNQNDWLLHTILPGVKDGMQAAGLTDEPPVILRTHATDLRQLMPTALKEYHNLYTEAKYTGESLTTSEPRGKWQEIHLSMSRLGSTHLANIHILSNLEPFRYGDQQFIQQCVQAARDRLGAKGIHLYPLCYWNWPDSPDRVDPPLKQIDRDWIWYEAWGRYAWNPDIPAAQDHAYWLARIADHYGPAAAADVLAAYNDSGECAPRLIRRFGITEGNRQTLSLGMTLDQLVKPEKYNALPDLWESDAPPGERLGEYADREWAHQPHSGETPPQIIEQVLAYSQKAVQEIDAAQDRVTTNRDEFERLRNDVHCIRAMSQFYAAKAEAALDVLRYQHSHNLDDLRAAEPLLSESVEHYRELAALGDPAYRFVNSMQTSQRKIPVVGGIGGHPANYLWGQVLPVYEKELAAFRQRLAGAGAVGSPAASRPAPLHGAAMTILGGGTTYRVDDGAQVYQDRPYRISAVAPQLVGLTGIQLKWDRTAPVRFHVDEPVQLLIGYFRSQDHTYAQPPTSETDAAAAELGSTEADIANAAMIPHLPPIDIYARNYPAGDNTLDLKGEGHLVVLGVVPATVNVAGPGLRASSAIMPATQPTRSSYPH